MPHTHHLDIVNHSAFLKQERIDPITGEKIEEGHTIVICAACKSAFFIESWEYLGNTHCNQEETLSEVPIAKSLQLVAKPLEYLPFLFRKGSYFAKEGKEGNREFAKTAMIMVLGGISFMILLLVSTFWLGANTSPIFGALLGFLELGVLGIIAKIYKKKQAFQIKDNPKKATYMVLDSKNQSINYKRNNKEIRVKFDEIKELKYSLRFMSSMYANAIADSHILSLEISTTQQQKISYHTMVLAHEISYWSKFLEELPYTIPVLNQK